MALELPIVRLWLRFRAQQDVKHGLVDPLLLTKACSPRDCSFLVSDDCLWGVCRHHGLVHYCTESTCQWWTVADDSRVCLVTAVRYPLNPEDADDWRQVLTNEHAACFKVNNPFAKEHADDNPYAKDPKTKKRVRLMSEFTRRLRKYTHDPELWKEETTQKRAHEAFAIIFGLLGSPERQRLNQELLESSNKHLKYKFQTYMDQRRKACKPVFFVVLWSFVVEAQNEFANQRLLQRIPEEQLRALCTQYAHRTVEYFARVAAITQMEKYQFRYHVLACLYVWAMGIKDQAEWLLEPDDDLRRLLPDEAHVQKLGFISRTFTRHCKDLRSVLVELSQQDFLHPSYTQAPLPRTRSAP